MDSDVFSTKKIHLKYKERTYFVRIPDQNTFIRVYVKCHDACYYSNERFFRYSNSAESKNNERVIYIKVAYRLLSVCIAETKPSVLGF